MSDTILVVDDSLVERLLLEGLLRNNPNYRIELAENGREALDKMNAKGANLVVTDLVMPGIDGLELVRRLRKEHPEVPVIVLTAYGDESTAVEALEAGAASYVPKARQAERLIETVDRVLEHAAADRSQVRLAQCMLEYHGRFALENDLQLIRSLVDHIQKSMAGIGLADTVERIRMGEALTEAILNAMFHGNLEVKEDELARVRAELDDQLLSRLVEERCREPLIRERKILVVVHLTEKEVRFVIRDEGRGFNSMTAAADASQRFEAGRHRGLTLIQSLMDEVSFNKSGNELTLRKRQLKPHYVNP